MDSLVKASSFKNNFRSLYIERKNDSIFFSINQRVHLKSKYPSDYYNIDSPSPNKFKEKLFRTGLTLYHNDIALIFAPCGFMEFVFHYSNDRGMHRSIVVKRKEITTEILKVCNLSVIDSTEIYGL